MGKNATTKVKTKNSLHKTNNDSIVWRFCGYNICHNRFEIKKFFSYSTKYCRDKFKDYKSLLFPLCLFVLALHSLIFLWNRRLVCTFASLSSTYRYATSPSSTHLLLLFLNFFSLQCLCLSLSLTRTHSLSIALSSIVTPLHPIVFIYLLCFFFISISTLLLSHFSLFVHFSQIFLFFKNTNALQFKGLQ